MVLLSHGLGSMSQDWTQRWPRLLGFVANGNRGVSVFFVISGFLITSLLLRERAKTGAISLRNFYVRRFFRIVPPFYAYLLCVLLLGVGGFFLTGLNHTWTGSVPLSFLCCLIAAELSWWLVEKPALRMRAHFERQPQVRQQLETVEAVCVAS